jgi:hypothetical protein
MTLQKIAFITGITDQDGAYLAEMVQADYTEAKRDALVKLAGFPTFDRHE